MRARLFAICVIGLAVSAMISWFCQSKSKQSLLPTAIVINQSNNVKASEHQQQDRLLATALSSGGKLGRANPIQQAQIDQAYGKLPLGFEINQGQSDPAVKFISRGPGYSLFLTEQETVLSLSKQNANTTVRMSWAGANHHPAITGIDQLPGRSNYLLGNDPHKWRKDIANYARVSYHNLYPGIDMVYYGNQQQLEYDLVVAPGSDPDQIRLQFQGADRISLNEQGELVLKTAGGQLIQHQPQLYQEVAGARKTVEGRYRLLANQQVGFEVGQYDQSRPLVIDPTLVYSTYLGGTGDDQGKAIAIDANGNAFITGFTASFDFPSGSTPINPNGGGDAFIAEISADGSTLVFSTFLGGSGNNDEGLGIALDGSGNIYLTGLTNSSDFPGTTNSLIQSSFGGNFDGFVAKLNPTADTVLYATYLGGSNSDSGLAIAVDGSGNAYVLGTTASTDFPTKLPNQTANGGSFDATVSVINTDGSQLIFSTYLGGAGDENPDFPFFETGHDIGSIAVDSLGKIYVTGVTTSTNFPTKLPTQSTNGGNRDAFVTVYNGTSGVMLFSTYLGGSGDDAGVGLVLDSARNIYISGNTRSSDFPTKTPFQSALNGFDDLFITKFSAVTLTNGSSVSFSTYLGGSGDEASGGLAVDSVGNIYLTGFTDSSDFPVRNAIQTTCNGCFFGDGSSTDAFVAKLSNTGSSLLFSTFLGGNNDDFGAAVAVDSAGNSYLVGSTFSFDFPVANPYQPGFADSSGGDTFITKISPNNPPAPIASVFPAQLTFSNVKVGNCSAPQNITVKNVGTAPLCVSDIFVNNKDYVFESDCPVLSRPSGIHSQVTGGCLDPGETCTVGVIFCPSTAGPIDTTLNINTNGGNRAVQLLGNDNGNAGSIQFSNATYGVGEGGTAAITVTRVGGDRGAVSAQYTTMAGNAKPADDYTDVSGTITFGDGDSAPKTFEISTVDDKLVEGNESVNLMLFNPTGGATIALGTATLTISDNDVASPGKLQFSQANYSVTEDGGSVTITVTRTGGDNVPVTVGYATSDGTAVAGTNYAEASGSLSFGAGDSSQSFNVRVFNDKKFSGDKTVNLVLSGTAGGAVLGSPSRATLTITEVDRPTNPGQLQADAATDFGGVNLSQLTTRSIKLRNIGGSPITINSINLASGLSNGFSITSQPASLTLAANESTSVELTFKPSSLGAHTGSVAIVTTGGSATVALRGQGIDTIAPSINVMSPGGGEILTAGTSFKINYLATDNDLVSNIVVSFMINGTIAPQAARAGDIARVDGKTGSVIWNLPADLQTADAQILITGRDRSGNIGSVLSGKFSIRQPQTTVPLLQTVINFTPPTAGQLAPPTNVTADARELGGGTIFNPAPVLQVQIRFDPPPTGQKLPPQNVTVTASELNGSLTGPVVINKNIKLADLHQFNPAAQGLELAGYNVYRVAEPTDGATVPAEQIVQPQNLVAMLSPSSLSFTDNVSTSDSSNYLYSIASFFNNGDSSGGSMPAGTDLPVIKNPAFRNSTLFIDAAGSFIKTGAQIIVNDADGYPLQFDISGTLLTVPKKATGSAGDGPIKKVIKKGSVVRLVVKNPDGKTSVGVTFTRTGTLPPTRRSSRQELRWSNQTVIRPLDDSLMVAGYNIYRVPQPLPGDPMPTPEEIVQPENLVGSVSGDMTSYTDVVSTQTSDNFLYSIASFFGGGQTSGGSMPAGTNLPVVKKPSFEQGTLFLGAGGSFVQQGAVLIVNDQESFPIQFDDSGTRLMVPKKSPSAPGNLTIDRLILKGAQVKLTIKNPDGKLSVAVLFTRR